MAESPPVDFGGMPSAIRAKARALARPGLSLPAKGRVTFLLVAAFVMVTSGAIAMLRSHLVNLVTELEAVYQRAEHLTAANASTTQALLEVTSASYAAAELVLTPSLALAVQSSVDSLRHAAPTHVPAERWAERIATGLQAVRQNPARSNWIALRETLRTVRADLQHDLEVTDERTSQLRNGFVRTFNLIAGTWIAAGLLGLAAVGIGLAAFFARLTRDVKRVEQRAGEIVLGYRGAPLALARSDEVGSLATAVDRMAEDLRERELRIDIERQAHAYGDKMAALGAFAAGVAHEVNNPLTAIAGHARTLSEAGAGDAAQQILEQVGRASVATRRLAALAAVQPEEFETIDFNGLLRQTVDLMRYDRRYRLIAWKTDLSPELPAVRTVPARLQQALSAVLGEAADDMSAAGGTLTVLSRSMPGWIECEILDTRGRGRAETLAVRLAADRTAAHDDELRPLVLATSIVHDLGGRLSAVATPAGLRLTVALDVSNMDAGL